MASQKRCNILSYDYLDIDVFWNVKLFYQAAGYQVEKNSNPASMTCWSCSGAIRELRSSLTRELFMSMIMSKN